MSKIYICAKCGEEFIGDKTEEEALKEYYETAEFEGVPIENAIIVCDDCYNELMKREPREE